VRELRAPVVTQVGIKIPGRPVAKGRPRATKTGIVYTPKATRDFEEHVAWMARSAKGKPFAPSDRLSVEISLHTKNRLLMGDIDNYAKSILDGLVKGGLIPDDGQIDHLCIERRRTNFEEDCTYVSVESL